MARATAARRCALSLLGERRRRDARARDLLRASGDASGLPERDRAFVTRLVLGVTAAEGALDRAIDAHLRRGARLEPRVRDALRLSAFELVYLGARPDAAVSQGVELVRGAAPRAAGLANAVLRRVAEEDVPAVEAARARVGAGGVGAAAAASGAEASGAVAPGAAAPGPSATDLALVGALPEWLCERALASLGPVDAVAWATGALGPAGAWAAANRAKLTTEEAIRLLNEAGCEPEEGPLPGSVLLGRPARLAASGLVEGVDVLPCDIAAQEVALAAAPAPGGRVLEVGQGRGTKTVLLEGAAVAAGGPCDIVAVEVDAGKSALAARRMRAAGVAGHVTCVAEDARALACDGAVGDAAAAEGLPDVLLGMFDLVFVDAPCTGTGTLARHPEIAWSLAPDSPEGLSRLQGEILAAASARVAPGGRLVYATCSVLAEEDERVVSRFLESPAGEGFELVGSYRTAVRSGRDAHFHAHLRRRV